MLIKNNLFVTLFFLPLLANACPIGMDEGSYGFGNDACLSSGEVKQITGSIENCPDGFSSSNDEWGNSVCSDGQITAYDTSDGCPKNMDQSWNQQGQSTCVGFDNHEVVELVD